MEIPGCRAMLQFLDRSRLLCRHHSDLLPQKKKAIQYNRIRNSELHREIRHTEKVEFQQGKQRSNAENTYN